jgi:hypothetical protein
MSPVAALCVDAPCPLIMHVLHHCIYGNLTGFVSDTSFFFSAHLAAARTLAPAWSPPRAASPQSVQRVRSAHAAVLRQSRRLCFVHLHVDMLMFKVTAAPSIGAIICSLQSTEFVCTSMLQALPRQVPDPSAAPPARGLPSRAASATPTPWAPPPGEQA